MERTVATVVFPVPPKAKLLRVAAYARVSSGKDAMLHSLSAQVSYYSSLIQKHKEWSYCGVYADEALTGTKDDRKEFQRLIAECKAGNIDRIITKSISRFARNTVTLLITVRTLKELGVGVYFEEQNIDTLSSDGELMMTILASYAQEESLSASENAKWRIRRGFENGELVNLRYLFGYRIVKGQVTVDPFAASVVREVFDRAIDGEPLAAIARDLNAREIRHVRGGQWSGTRVREMLANEKYTGNALLQKTFVNNHLEKRRVPNRGELPRYYAEGTHPAIIDADTFARAKERLLAMDRAAEGRTKPSNTTFTKMLRCGKCGAYYRRTSHAGKAFWNCHTYTKLGKAFCKTSLLPEETLWAATAEVLGTQSFDRDDLCRAVESITVLDGLLTFHMVDGQKVEKPWAHRSRAKSWTPEMKEAARQKTLARRNQDEVQTSRCHLYASGS